MNLPTITELQDLYSRKGEEGIPTSGAYWSSQENGSISAEVFDIEIAHHFDDRKDLNSNYYAFCLSN